MSRPVDAVIDFLEAETARGKTHVFLDDAARDGLRALYLRAKGRGPAAAPATQPAAPTAEISDDGGEKAERLAALRSRAENWQPARELGTLRETMVFSAGSPDARVMLVGEAPGHEEERRREPFVGPAGQKLTDILKAMGLSRREVYISNIVKFRPKAPNQTTNNRKPTPVEMECCLPFVMKEISIVQPEAIIALGGTAAQGLLKLEGTVGSMRGKWHECQGIPVRVTYHPSYLLQSGADSGVKRQLWEDMLAVMEKIDMDISEKQRGFFLPK
ncbi:MAG: uracil-DNA glycosylase [Verrucomicrobiota bacterium]